MENNGIKQLRIGRFIIKRWIVKIFCSWQAMNGGVSRRQISDVEHFAGLHELIAAARRNGAAVLKWNDQVIVLHGHADRRNVARWLVEPPV